MSIRDSIRRLKREAEGNTVAIPQQDGTVLRFPEHPLRAAFINAFDRTLGKDLPEHPLSAAARNSTDPQCRDCVVSGPEGVHDHPEELSV